MSDQAPMDLHDYLASLPHRRVKLPAVVEAPWSVLDDWPEQVPVNRHEVAVFAAFFGDILDDLFGLV